MATPVFTYGSLMFPDVWDRVVDGRYRSTTARLANHQRLAVRDETYPGLVERRGASVDGVVYLEVDALDVERLDAFEGDDYRRVVVAVDTAAGDRIDAQAYLYLPVERLAPDVWRPEAFALDRFLATYCRDKFAE